MRAPLIRYVLKAAIRDRLVISMIILMAMVAALSVFLGSAAIIEQDRFVAVYSAGAIRSLNAFGLVLFVVFFIRRSFDARDVEFMLARPVSRLSFVLSYSAGLTSIAALMAVVSGLLIVALTSAHFSEGHLIWVLSLICENIIIINAGLFFSMVLSSAATASFATLGFYVLSRMMTEILGILDSGIHPLQSDFLKTVMQGISMMMPRLDLFGQTSWLIYGADPQVSPIFLLAQGAIYTAILLLAACLDLNRRQF